MTKISETAMVEALALLRIECMNYRQYELAISLQTVANDPACAAALAGFYGRDTEVAQDLVDLAAKVERGHADGAAALRLIADHPELVERMEAIADKRQRVAEVELQIETARKAGQPIDARALRDAAERDVA